MIRFLLLVLVLLVSTASLGDAGYFTLSEDATLAIDVAVALAGAAIPLVLCWRLAGWVLRQASEGIERRDRRLAKSIAEEINATREA